MDFATTITNQEGIVRDELLERLLSDPLFNEFDPVYWSCLPINDDGDFADRAFPTLAKYHSGEELKSLAKGHPWLTNIDKPSMKHEAARAFHQNSASNLTVLDVFIRLQFLHIFGSAMMCDNPLCEISCEITKILNPEDPVRKTESGRSDPPVDEKQVPLQPERRNASFSHDKLVYSLTSQKSIDEYKDKFGGGTKSEGIPWDIFLSESLPDARDYISMEGQFGDVWRIFEEKRDHLSCGDAGIAYNFDWTPCRPFSIKDLSHPNVRAGKICIRAMHEFLTNSIRQWNSQDVMVAWQKINDSTQMHSESEVSIPSDLLRSWKRARESVTHGDRNYGSLWKKFCNDLWSFCLAAGCPKADRDSPFESLEALRDQVSRQFVYTADLHDQISKLNRQVILQQRMITALAYRNVIENLSATTPGSGFTVKWRNFLAKMFKAVRDGKVPDEGNPFADFFDKFNMEKRLNLEYLEQMAVDLYSTLSRTIHSFQASEDFGQWTPVPGQFDPEQIAFMVDMMPLKKHFASDGNPNWEKERERYPGHFVDRESIEIAMTAKSSESKAKKEKNTVKAKASSIIFPNSNAISKDLLDDLDASELNKYSSTDQSVLFDDDTTSKSVSQVSPQQLVEIHRQTVALEKLADAVVEYLENLEEEDDED